MADTPGPATPTCAGSVYAFPVDGGKQGRNTERPCLFDIQLDILCYTHIMQPEREYWPEWAQLLQRWGMKELAALLLESAGPLTFFLAQLVYIGQPLFGERASARRLNALANLFENQEESRSFAAFLREEKSS